MTRRAEHESLGTYLAQVLSHDERQRVGIITFNHWSFAVGTVIETVLEARALGSDVTVGFWANYTPLPDVGWRSSRFLARISGSSPRDKQAQKALEQSGVPKSVFVKPPIQRWRGVDLPAVPSPSSRPNIRKLRYRGTALGPAILEMPPNGMPVSEGHVWPRRWVSAAIRSYAWAYDQATALIEQRNLTTVVVYNGRFTHDRAVAAAAKDRGIRVLYYDTGGYDTHFDLTEASTHDWAHLQQRMLAMYETWDLSERDQLGGAWFEDRRSHADVHNQRFTGVQQRGRVDGIPPGTRLIVYFSSSGDEIVELDIDWSQYFGSQEQALATLIAECRKEPGTVIAVRTHPHMRLKPQRDRDDWVRAVDELQPDVHFGPESPVDSYALMERADVVFTYGSTSGVEAAYFGRPVVVMGPSAYDQLGCAHRVSTAEEIAEFLKVPPPINGVAAVPYGLMMQRRGFTYAHAAPTVDDSLILSGARVAEANTNALKLSDAWRKMRTWWLTRA